MDAIINLAGESLFGYWTKSKKDRIYQSRIKATYAIIDMIKEMKYKPAVLINASAVGYFGTSLTETFTESRKESRNDFLAEVTEAWEKNRPRSEYLWCTYGYCKVWCHFRDGRCLAFNDNAIQMVCWGQNWLRRAVGIMDSYHGCHWNDFIFIRSSYD